MLFKSTLLSVLAASGATALRSCGAPEPTEEELLVAQNLQIIEEEARLAGNSSRIAAASINVKIYWHVLASSNTSEGGYLSQETLDAQLDVLNDAFSPHGVSFTTAGADWTIDAVYARDGSELAMKRALRKGTYADLNIYLAPAVRSLGYAYFPQPGVSEGSTTFYRDGTTVRSTTVPGGSMVPYDLGHTATHEVGHWLGLYHTFQGGCGSNGDFVDDTPAEAEPAWGCEIGRDTCPAAGLDPVTNYMDYSDDACFDHFTLGQEERIFSYWNAYRAQFQTEK